MEVREEVRPPWPFRLGGASMDGLLRRRGAALQRLLRIDGEPVLVGIVQPARRPRAVRRPRADGGGRAGRRSRGCASPPASTTTCARSTTASRDDPVIGRAVRSHPGLRVRRQPDPWRDAAGRDHRAADRARARDGDPAPPDRRLRLPLPGDRDARRADGRPSSPRRRRRGSSSFDLAPKRALALRRCAEAVAPGRLDLRDHDLRRLRAIPEIGPWTFEMLALHGQGRYDLVPGRRPRLPQARRPARDRQPARARRRGRGARLLRALRRVEGPGRRAPGARGDARAHSSPDVPGSSPSPGRNSLVSGARSPTGCLSSPLSRIQRS